MMFRIWQRKALIIILFLISTVIFSLENNTLIIYNGRNSLGGADKVLVLRELLGKFTRNVDIIDAEKYLQGQIYGYDKVFYLSNLNVSPREKILNDLARYEGSLFWMGEGIKWYLKYKPELNLEFGGIDDGDLEVKYLVKTSLPYIERTFPIFFSSKRERLEGDEIISHSRFADGVPYVGQKKNFWYTSVSFEVYGPLLYIFCDILYDFYQVENIPKSSLYIRLEDVHPFRDIDKLKEVGDFLYGKGIPFMIALIPAYQAIGSNKITKISEKPKFAETIRYLQSKGASIVLHGYTHKAFERETTGEGYEFWDGIDDKPLEAEKVPDIKSWVHERVGAGIKECLKEEIYPLAFEAPHYAASSNVYIELKTIFSTYVGQIQVSDESFITINLPYEIQGIELFNQVIPENLGYVRDNDEFFLERILEKHKEISIVRGSMLGVFFHPYLDINYLKKIVGTLGSDINYYDMKNNDHWVKWEGIEIQSKNNEVIVTGFVSEKKGNLRGYIEKLISYVVKGLKFAFLILIVVYVISRKKYKKNIFK